MMLAVAELLSECFISLKNFPAIIIAYEYQISLELFFLTGLCSVLTYLCLEAEGKSLLNFQSLTHQSEPLLLAFNIFV